ncbi:polyadenylate-binding protein-interacting protein 6 isoform X2 [Sesamum indicum]|uniref:Polyadenylate-binding protein-interacting protein 6 isoform X2 n=1 Tax=Sesamum indicum TaxID=4182 RepID=A0A6I9TDP7_SESIN|nr:polyadenylate-binding protein-interacting protein 6 isoform X2 [Sesamum indicum]
MKTGRSSLNPYAASYVPLSKRRAADEGKILNTAKELQNGSEIIHYGHQPDNKLTRGQQQNVSQNYVHTSGSPQTAEFTKWKGHHAGEFYASSSHYPNEIREKSNFDQEFMDLAYLQINFPGISEESLSDVYLANKCDLDSAVDMLNQLEIYPDDSSDKLPDTLDIGDVPESVSSSGLVSLQEQRNSTAKAGASTSGSSKFSSTS